MKKTFLLTLVAVFFSLLGIHAQDVKTLPTFSPANGTADVWYHIQLEQRVWGLNEAGSEVINGGSIKGYYFDQGDGKLLKNVLPINELGSRWKLVGNPDNFQLISGLGNTLDYASTAADIPGGGG